MGALVREYEETYTERRTRRVRVVDDENGEITAWHGGRLLAKLGGWDRVPTALREAAEAAEAFGVGPGSSLSIRVSRTVTRRVEYPDDRGGLSPSGRVIHRRHVHDAVAGDLPFTEAALAFRLSAWVGVPRGEDPGPYLAFYVAPEVDGISDAALFEGYGHGEPTWSPAAFREPEVAPPPFQRGDEGKAWHRVAMEGRLPVFVPAGGSADRLLAPRTLSLDIDCSFRELPDRLQGRAQFRGCHAPEDRVLSVAP